MPKHNCPECGKPMTLVQVLPPLHQQPRLGAFYCRPCEFADSIPVVPENEAPALSPA